MLDPVIQEIQGVLGVNLTQKSPVIGLISQLIGQDLAKGRCIHAIEILVFNLNHLAINNMRVETHSQRFITLLENLRNILSSASKLNMTPINEQKSRRNTILLNRTFIKLKMCADKLEHKLSDTHDLEFNHVIQWTLPHANASKRSLRSGGIEFSTHNGSSHINEDENSRLLDNNNGYCCNPFKFKFF